MLLHCSVLIMALAFQQWFFLPWSCLAGTKCEFTANTFPDRGHDLEHNWGSGRFQLTPEVVLQVQSKIEATMARDNPVVIHIGPSTLWGEKSWYSDLVKRGPFRVIFVEPNPVALSSLQEKVNSLGAKEGSIQILNAAVCPNTTGNVSFWRPSKKLFEDYFILRMLEWMVEEWVSLSRKQLMLTINHAHLFANISEDLWPLYSEEIPVRCVTPRSLLEELNVDPADVRLLLVDAEGYDADIVEKFFEIKGLIPEYLQFEWLQPGKYEQLLKVIETLAARRYSLHRIGQDIQAILAD